MKLPVFKTRTVNRLSPSAACRKLVCLLAAACMIGTPLAYASPKPISNVAEATWESVDLGTSVVLRDIWGFDDDNVWIMTDSSTLFYWNGVLWTEQDNGLEDAAAIHGVAPDNVWIISFNGELSQWDGQSWSPIPNSGNSNLVDRDADIIPLDLWVDDSGRPWAVGTNGLRMVWNGSSWAPTTGLGNGAFFGWLGGVFGLDENTIWAVSEAGVVARWDGSLWNRLRPVTDALNNIFATDVATVWAVGQSGIILRCHEGVWSQQSSGTDSALTDVWARDADNAWVVGDNGALLYWNGSQWATQTSGSSAFLTGIWGSGAKTLWVIGGDGTLLKSTQEGAPSAVLIRDGFESEAARTPC